MMEIRHLLLATDFSDCAQAALEHAFDLAQRYDATLHLLHVVHDVTLEVPDFAMGLSFPGYVENLPERRRQTTESVKQQLEELASTLVGLPHPPECHVRFGQPVSEILDFVEEQGMQLIVLGTHGRTGLPHVVLGSVAERVIQRASCPVLTVRQHQG